ncbi:MAG: DUF4623 domain-containing protein [Bacteroidetes bacterium]|nr:MAG: DUF4623 domain-containing protein [Bacteroidota bacterium]
MKKFTQMSFAFLMIFLLSGAFMPVQANKDSNALDPVTILMDKSQASGTLPDFINDAGASRGAAFNGQYVFVASRQGGNNIYYWNVNNPDAEPQTLNMTGVSGGTFPINDVTTAGNHIFGCNMVMPGMFKVYHWSSLTVEPQVLIEYDSGTARLGDAFTVIGNPAQSASVVVSALNTNNFYVWEIENGTLVSGTPEIIEATELDGTVNFARVTQVPGENLFVVSGSSIGVALIDEDLNLLAGIPSDFFPYWSMYPHIFYHKGERFLAYIHVKTDPVENKLYILDLNDGATVAEAMTNLAASTFADEVVYSVSLGTVSNGNASVGLDVVTDPFGNVRVMAYAAGNGFVLQQFGDEAPDGMPLPFMETFDGEGEDTPDIWLPEGWVSIDANNDGFNWYWSPGPSADPNGQMRSQSAYQDDEGDWQALSPDNWLITPRIFMTQPGENEKIQLSFKIATGAQTPGFRLENYSVLISTSDTEFESFENLWTETLTADFDQNVFYLRELDLSAYAGEEVYIAFRHHDVSDMDRLFLDDVFVEIVADEEPEELIYSISIFLNAGEVEYKYFVVVDDPSWDLGEWTGGANRVFMVEGDATVEDIWGDRPDDNGDGKGDKDNGPFVVTFKVDMTGAMVGEDEEAFAFDPELHKVFIAGSFGGEINWSQPGSNPSLEMTIGDTGVVSVPEIAVETSHVKLFPNPAGNQFTINSDNRINQVVVYDVTGRMMENRQVDGFEVRMDSSDLNNGIYIVRVYTDAGVVVNKLQVHR